MINWISFDNGNMYAFYGSRSWKRKRKEILARDHNKCQRCLGRWDKQSRISLTQATIVHHIIPVKADHSKALTDSNLISLCFNCHEEVEGRAPGTRGKKNALTEERW